MVAFEQTLDIVKKILPRWNSYEEIRKVTVIRDVLGRLAFLLEAEKEVGNERIRELSLQLKKDLGAYFQGNIYVTGGQQSDFVKKMIKEIQNQRVYWDTINQKEWFLLERAIAKKAWVDCRFQEEAIWPYEEAQSGTKAKVITFYSFKGGMGRTTSLAAVALALAQKGKNVLMIDTDIEAPGLATLFLDEESVEAGTVDYLLESSLTSEKERISMETMLRQVIDPVLMEEITGKLFLIPSGKIAEGYLQKLARIDFQDAIPDNMKQQLSKMIKDAVQAIVGMCKIDYILLDARAGFHDMGGVVTAQIPHGVVLFGKDSRQSWQGINLVLRTISTSQKSQPFVAIVDSACGRNGLITEAEKYNFTDQSYSVFCESYYNEEEMFPAVRAQGEAHSPIFVPYQPFLADDVQLYSDGSNEKNEMVRQLKETLLAAPYQEIANRIQSWFNEGNV